MGGCFRTLFQHVFAAAIGAFDLPIPAEGKVDARVPQRPVAAVAGDHGGFDGNDLERFHFHPTSRDFRRTGASLEPLMDPALTPFRADDTHAPIGESTAAHRSPYSAQPAVPAPLRRLNPRPDQG